MRFFSFSYLVSQTPEYFFGNIAFIVLFIAVLLYWFDFSNTSETSVVTSFFDFKINKNWKNFCMIGANISLAFLLIVRWFESGHFPLSNLYESLIGLSWGFTTVHLIVALDFTKILRLLLCKKQLNFAMTEKSNFLQPSASSEVPNLLGTSTDVFAKQEAKAGASYQLYAVSKAKTASGNTVNASMRTLLMPTPKETLQYEPGKFNENNQPYFQFSDKIGAITAPTALLTSVFATFFLPPEMVRATALIPALKSNWLTMHVTVMVASYAFLLVGSLLSIAFCVYRFIMINKADQNPSIHFANQSAEVATGSFNDYKQTNSPTLFSKTEKAENFDTYLDSNVKDVCIWLNTMSYRILGLGFPLLTIGILSGAVWANEAWGSYWSWDPKETWALITWLVFAVYFHSRYTRNSDTSPVPAAIASVGFVTIWICYLGVNLIGTGLHSYGWFVY